MSEIAAYGTWRSALTIDTMIGRIIGLGGLQSDGDTLLWLESCPAEAGRSTLMRWHGGVLDEVTPAPFDVGTRVHEYGGGAFTGRNGTLVFSDRRSGTVWLIRDGGEPRPIASVAGCRFADFALDPSGERVFAVREDHRSRPPNDPLASLVALDLTGTIEPTSADGQVLVSGADFLAAPRPDPTGSRLAWIEWDHPDMPWDATRLKRGRLSADGGVSEIEALPSPGPEAIHSPLWTDADTILFVSDRTGFWQIHEWRGDAVTRIAATEGEIGGPAWVLGGQAVRALGGGRLVALAITDASRRAIAIDPDGSGRIMAVGPVADTPVRFGDKLAVIATPHDRPPVLTVLSNAGDAEGTAIREAGAHVLAPEDISIGRGFSYPTTGGETAHAIFYQPRNHRFTGPAGQLPPLMTLVHGGPTSMSTVGFSLAVQWWTSRGFAVLDVNYRGSSGYGRAYRQALNGKWGVSDVEDCVAAARHLIAIGAVDPERIAIRGGSAGGFTVLACLAGSDLFKAGTSLYGIGDLRLLASDTHKFEARYMDRLVGPLPASAALFAERSPLNHIDRIRAPVLLFQGKEDRVVPPNQAEALAASLSAHGVPVELHLFEGEGHGFRRAETMRQVLKLELDFYRRHFALGDAAPEEA